MPTQKNQHFVPQFYQRFFSSDNKAIASYLIKDNRIVTSPIKNTASKDYMYSINGKEEDGADFEQILSLLESRIAETFNYIVANNSVQNKLKKSQGFQYNGSVEKS